MYQICSNQSLSRYPNQKMMATTNVTNPVISINLIFGIEDDRREVAVDQPLPGHESCLGMQNAETDETQEDDSKAIHQDWT
jgi:hypothetical protein